MPLEFDGVNGIIKNTTSDGDITIKGNDGGSEISALVFDMSAEGAATFNSTVALTSFAATDGCTITTADNDPQLILTSTDADADEGPRMNFVRNSGSPANNDVLARISLQGKDAGANTTSYAELETTAVNVAEGSETGKFNIKVAVAGSVNQDVITMTGSEVVINDSSNDIDFRVESNGNANMLHVNGGNNLVGIGADPDLGAGLHIKTADSGASAHASADELVIEGSANSGINILSGNSAEGGIYFGDDGDNDIGRIRYDHANNSLDFFTNAAERMSLASNGGVIITTGDNTDTLTLVSTDNDTAEGPVLKFNRSVTDVANGDLDAAIKFQGENDAGEAIVYNELQSSLGNVADGSEGGRLTLYQMIAGTSRNIMDISQGNVIFNQDSIDGDFRVESNGDANCLIVDAGLDTVIMGASGEYSGTSAKLTVTPQIDVGDTSLTGTSAVHFIRAASTGVIGGIYGKWAGYGSGGYLKFNADNVGGGSQTASIVMGTTLNNSTADRFNIAGNGDLTATDTSIGSISDERLKENIADFNYDISKFKQLKPRSYKWKNPIYHGNKVDENGDALTSYGTIAQEVAAVDADYVRDYEIKDEVNFDKDLLDADNVAKTTTITGKGHAMYISVIQQLITRIEALEG